MERVQSDPGKATTAFVERFDEADDVRAEDCAGEVPDAAEDGCGERDQDELKPLVEADRRELEDVDQARGSGRPPARANVNEMVRFTLMPTTPRRTCPARSRASPSPASSRSRAT